MSDKLVFEDVNFDVEFSDSTPKNFFSGNRGEWLLWFIEAYSREEREHLQKISEFCTLNNTLIIPLSELKVMLINVGRSSFIRKLIKSGVGLVNKTDITLIRQTISSNAIKDFFHDLESFYRTQSNRVPANEKIYPTGEFFKFPGGTLITVEHSKLHIIDFEAEEVANRIIEVKFADQGMPGLIFPSYSLQNVKETIKNKLVYHLSDFASEKADFFSMRILHNRELFHGKKGYFSDKDLPISSDKTSKNYRKMYTKALLNKYVKSDVNFRNLIQDLETHSSNYILTRYSYNEPRDYDFLQTLLMAHELFQKETEITDVTILSLVRNVMDEVKLFVTEDELKWTVIGADSDFPESKYNEIYSKFLDEYVFRPSKMGKPKILKYTIPAQSGGDETILIHVVNLNRMLNIRLEKALRQLPDFFNFEWKKLIRHYSFSRDMFIRKDFQESILGFLNENFFMLSRLIRKPSLYRILNTIKDVSVIVDRLRLHETGAFDKIFNLDYQNLYLKAYFEVINELTGFKRIFFRIFHWFSKKKAVRKFSQSNGAIHEKSDVTEKPELKQGNSMSQSDLSVEQVRNIQDQLWEKLPQGKIPKDEIDNNLSADVHVFLQERRETPFASLQFVADNNVTNILNKAPFLMSYKKALHNYCMERIKYIVLKNPHHRSKCLF